MYLSLLQKKLLSDMAEGKSLTVLSPSFPYQGLYGRYRIAGRRVHQKVVNALYDKKLIQIKNPWTFLLHFELTELGREAIEHSH